MPEAGFYATVESRRSVRDFLPDPVPEEALARALDAARLAPSSSNLQPWEFIVIRDPGVRERANAVCLGQQAARTAPLLLAVVSHQGTWRRHRDELLRAFEDRGTLRPRLATYYRRLIPAVYTTGPFGLLGPLKRGLCRLLSLVRPMANLGTRSDLRVMAHKSTALAAATLMLALRAEGYDSCPMEGFDPWRARTLLGLPRGAEVCMFLAVGRRSEAGVWWDRVLMPREWVVRDI